MSRTFKCLLFFIISAIFLLQTCSGPPRFVEQKRQPVIEVGLVQHQDAVNFLVSGPFSIYAPNDRFIGKGTKGITWTATPLNFSAATTEFRLRYANNLTQRAAELAVSDLQKMRLRAEIVENPAADRERRLAMKGTPANSHYDVLLIERFGSAMEAGRFRTELGRSFPLEIIEQANQPKSGNIEIRNDQIGKVFEVPSGSRIQADRFAILDMPIGEGYHWEKREDQVFRGSLKLTVDKNQKVTAINIIEIESYLRGVVPAEMPSAFPLEALKAQAVAARSEVLRRVQRKVHQADGFDICSTVHCQVYNGISKESPQSDQAIRESFGLILNFDGEIADAVYHAVCGGYTEANDIIWSGASAPYLQAHFDGKGKADLLGEQLRQKAVVRKWIDNALPVYCNTVSGNFGSAFEYTKKYFRWKQFYKREELETYIQEATGQSFGQLRDLRVVARSISGRITRLQVVGTTRNFEIEKDLPIRRALSEQPLYSSCFYILKDAGSGNLPASFTFVGAGWGHGVGMCQTGAGSMGLKGGNMIAILRHYYPGTVLAEGY